MHGLINRTIECFLSDAYGSAVWKRVVEGAGQNATSFESMMLYEDGITYDLLQAAAQQLDKPRSVLLEDIGTYLVSHQNTEALRRLLRFGGDDFFDFLHSLEDLPDRARLAVSDLDLPGLRLTDHRNNEFTLELFSQHDIFAHVFIGILRAMADDYGTLIMLDYCGRYKDCDTISISLFDMDHSRGRDFRLAAVAPQQQERRA